MPTLLSDLARTLPRALPQILLCAGAATALFWSSLSALQIGLAFLTLFLMTVCFLCRTALVALDRPQAGTNAATIHLPPLLYALGHFLFVGVLFVVFGTIFFLLITFCLVLVGYGSPDVVAILSVWSFFVLFGSLLPATAAGRRFEPLTALRILPNTAGQVTAQLLLPGLYLWAFARVREGVNYGLKIWAFPDLALFAAELVMNAISSVAFVMIAVILTRAYLQAWPSAKGITAIFD